MKKTTYAIDGSRVFDFIIDPNMKSSDLLKEYLESVLEHKTYKKGEFLLREGQTCKWAFFIESGMIQQYTVGEDKEQTTWLLQENDLVTSVKSFFHQIPSPEFIVALEPTIVTAIRFDHLQTAFQRFPEFEIFCLNKMRSYYERLQDRIGSLRAGKPATNYKWLMETSPELATRAPLKPLSSYLLVSVKKLTEVRGIRRKKAYKKKNQNKR